MVAIKDANGKYTLNFRKCVIIEVVEKQTSIREAIRIYWNVYTRREEDLYTKTVRSWIKLYNKFGVYIMERKKNIDIHLRKEDFRTNEELLAFEDFDNAEETAKTVQKLKLALLQQQQLTDFYKKKQKNEETIKKSDLTELNNNVKPNDYNIKVDKGYLYNLFDISRQNSSYHNNKPKSDKYEFIRNLIARIFYYSSETYGYRRIHEALKRLHFKIGRNKVLQLMNEMGLHPYFKRKVYHPVQGKEDYRFPNKVKQNFTADAPYQLLLSDVTEIRYKNTKIYLSVVMDVFNSEILAYDLRKSANKEQALTTFENLIKILPKDSRPLLHTDQGWQYRNPDIVKMLSSANIEQSMSRAGNCLDNAMMESWFGRFKTEMIHKKHFENLDELADKIHKYIIFYNEERIHSRLCYLSPKEYKEIYFLNLKKA